MVGQDGGQLGTKKFRHSTKLREEFVDFVVVVEEEVTETSRYCLQSARMILFLIGDICPCDAECARETNAEKSLSESHLTLS